MNVKTAQPKIIMAQPADKVCMQTVIKNGNNPRQLYGNLNGKSDSKKKTDLK